MPRAKPRRKLDVFHDETAEHVQSPQPKRRRTADAAPAQRQLRRAALEDKAANSSDNSLLPALDTKIEACCVDEKPSRKSKKVVKEDPLQVKAEEQQIDSLVKEETPAQKIYGILENIVPDGASELSLLTEGTKDDFQLFADFIFSHDCWTPELVAQFGSSGILTLNFNLPDTPRNAYSFDPGRPLLEPLFHQGQFTSLSTLTLRNRALADDDLALLRLLPALETLDLCGTIIGDLALHHLVCHRHTLKSLNISLNERVTDDARIILRAFPKLTALFLRGTSLTVPAVRKLATEDLAKSCRILSLPSSTIAHLNTRDQKYAMDIPKGYIEEPNLQIIANMTLPNLKRNLELHAKINKDIQVTGTKVELAQRLKAVLWGRLADIKILAVLGRGGAKQ